MFLGSRLISKILCHRCRCRWSKSFDILFGFDSAVLPITIGIGSTDIVDRDSSLRPNISWQKVNGLRGILDHYWLTCPRSPSFSRSLPRCLTTLFVQSDGPMTSGASGLLSGGDMILADGVSQKESEEVTELREGKIDATFIDGDGRVLPKCVRCLWCHAITSLQVLPKCARCLWCHKITLYQAIILFQHNHMLYLLHCRDLWSAEEPCCV